MNETTKTEAKRSEAQAEAASRQPSPKRSETLSVGEAAKMLGVSVSTVQRLCDLRERNPDADPAVGLPTSWTSAHAQRQDINGRPLRGHRLIPLAAVEAYRRALGEEIRRASDAANAPVTAARARSATLLRQAARVRARAEELGLSTSHLAAVTARAEDAASRRDAANRSLSAEVDRMERAIREAVEAGTREPIDT